MITRLAVVGFFESEFGDTEAARVAAHDLLTRVIAKDFAEATYGP